MVAAGLLARNALGQGLDVPDYVKTSLAPGGRVVTEYLKQADLLDDLEGLGYNVVGYGCTTCIRNAGPLADPIEAAIDDTRPLDDQRPLGQPATSKPASIRRSARTTSPVRRLSSPTVWRARWTSTSRTNRSARTTTAKTSSSRTSGRTHRRSRRRSTRTSPPSCSETSTRASSRGDERWGGPRRAHGRSLRLGRRVDVHPRATVLPGLPARGTQRLRHRGCALSAHARRHRDDRPHQPRGAVQRGPARRPVAEQNAASNPTSSTPTALAAGITRS